MGDQSVELTSLQIRSHPGDNDLLGDTHLDFSYNPGQRLSIPEMQAMFLKHINLQVIIQNDTV